MKNITLLSDIVSIGYDAFYKCTNLTLFKIPENVSLIERNAFSGSGLKSITIPKKITTINDNVFCDCSKLNYIYFFGNITSIGTSSFSKCGDFYNIIIPESVVSIGESAFSYSKLTKIIIP